MAKVAGYIVQRRQAFYAVVDVPPLLRKAVGRNRLVKTLGTRDKHVAKARLPRALLELHARIDAARRGRPETDPVTAEALALREQMEAVRAGELDGWRFGDRFVEAPDGERIEVPLADMAADLLVDTIAERAEQIGRAEGTARERAFVDMALGRATPLTLHVEEWLAEPGQKGRYRDRTKADYRRIVQGFVAWLAEAREAALAERVTRRIAGRYLASLHEQGLSNARIRTIIAALSGYWQWMERRGVIAAETPNPWTEQAPRKPKGDQPREEERAFTDGELTALFAGTNDPFLSDLMRVAALSGMRIEELCRLTVAMCGGGVFDAPGTKTEAAARKVPIHPDLAPIIVRRCEGKAAGAYLFHELADANKHGERSPAASKRFNRYRQTVGVHERAEGQRRSRVNFHSFRRWFVTSALRAGQELRVVKQIVGHKLPKADVTLGAYFRDGDTLETKQGCVAAVRLPALPAPVADDFTPPTCIAAE